MINEPGKKLNICIVGYGPAGTSTAIGLYRLGHTVTMYERSFYNFRDPESRKQNMDMIYPVKISHKGQWVIDWLRCRPIFDKHLNVFEGMTDEKGKLLHKEPKVCYMSSHLEIMYAF